jgi:hypothetical protein
MPLCFSLGIRCIKGNMACSWWSQIGYHFIQSSPCNKPIYTQCKVSPTRRDAENSIHWSWSARRFSWEEIIVSALTSINLLLQRWTRKTCVCLNCTFRNRGARSSPVQIRRVANHKDICFSMCPSFLPCFQVSLAVPHLVWVGPHKIYSVQLMKTLIFVKMWTPFNHGTTIQMYYRKVSCAHDSNIMWKTINFHSQIYEKTAINAMQNWKRGYCIFTQNFSRFII